jgi:FKBP-type peptidyl-prolyl cis-trans isomerase
MMLSVILSTLVLAPQGGLVVKTLQKGSGPAAADGDVLAVMYKGTLSNGTVFDENSKRPPFALRLGAGQVIKGWDMGLKGAKAGSKLKLTIPPGLAYGERAVGSIPANSTLTFEIEVLRVDPKNAEQKISFVDLKKGSGQAATSSSKVSLRYKGTFLNGVVFDQSDTSPFEFQMGTGNVIKGFEQGILGMRVGGKRKVTIPYQLAYGEVGRPPRIPQMTALVFELELVAIK